jgi:alpha-mannosidase
MISKEQRVLYRDKIRKFISRLKKLPLAEYRVLSAEYAVSKEQVLFSDRLGLSYAEISEKAKWGSEWDSGWFHLKGEVPSEWKGREVVADLDFNGEGLVFSTDGVPLQGLSHGSVFGGMTRSVYRLFDKAKGGEEVDLWIETAATGLFGVDRDEDAPRDCPKRHGTYSGIVSRIRVAAFDRELWQLCLDMDLLFLLMEALDEDSTRAARILAALNESADAFVDDSANAKACREILKPVLSSPANASAITMTAVGHAHIDTGWLWPVREGVRKCARTFSTQLDLLDQYPEYVFGASQAQHYLFVKERYPELYEKIVKAVKDGRWEPQGGMWVEADCNLISGESMVRQILHGKNFFMDEFGFEVKNCWIPDVFGYSAAMPQILKRAGIDYFLTQKLSWSQFNKFPHTTFNWQGIDGSEVLTHFPPENNYNSKLMPDNVIHAEKNFREKAVLDEMICLFGIGDGGGGPTPEHIEWASRQSDLEGMPRVKCGRADDFFTRISEHAAELPTWVGELYLERHRGTLTTQSRIKKGNRKIELSLRETEYLLSMLPLKDYPGEALDRIWKLVLMNQFHDILPGSSIKLVNEVTEQEHRDSLEECDELKKAAVEKLASGNDDCLTVINTMNRPYVRPILLPEGWAGVVMADGTEISSQKEADGRAVAMLRLPAQGICNLKKGEEVACDIGDGLVLENDLARYEFDENGELVGALDKETGREILESGCNGNVFTLYNDRPNNWEAWDIDIFYEAQDLETAKSVSAERVCDGPVRQGVRFDLSIGESSITQKVYLSANSKCLDFETDVDWKERHRMLRVAFPVNIRSSEASFDVQYGYVKRPTHRNTSWDMARFEVAAHKYADLSDNDTGVALLNDCKYGHKVLDNVMDLNLLRSPMSPDPDADIGHHSFTYSLFPHAGTLIQSDVMLEADMLNQPPLLLEGIDEGGLIPPVTVTGEGVSLEVVKKAEKRDSVVIRLVERRGCRTTATVTMSNPDAKLVETDLMEWTDGDELGSGAIEIEMKPFDILTFEIR